MSTSEDSAGLLRRYWDGYAAGYEAKLGRPPTMRGTSDSIDLDPSSLSRWTGTATPPDRRIPLHLIPRVATVLMLTDDQRDLLMDTRVRELCGQDKGLDAVYRWFSDFYRRTASPKLDAEEVAVLRDFNDARDRWPRGLYGDVEESTELRCCLDKILRRAEGLHAAETAAERDAAVPDKARLERIKRQMRAARRDARSAYTLAKRAARQLGGPKRRRSRHGRPDQD